MIYNITNVFDNLENEALKLLNPDDDVTNHMKVHADSVTDKKLA
jgi:hypothetical protein